MINWRALPSWLFRAWPAFSLLPLFALHYLALSHFSGQTLMVNKITGSALQIVGGFLILVSIDQNLGLFHNESVISAISAWFKSFPLKRSVILGTATGSVSASSSATGLSTVAIAPTTLEGRISALENGLEALRVQLHGEINKLNTRIAHAQNDLQHALENTNARLGSLTKQLEDATVGGAKLQAFGVLLAVYGAITSVFA